MKEIPTPTTDPNEFFADSEKVEEAQLSGKNPMTQEEVESYIMLKGQGDDRWFEIRILDPEVGQDPTMLKLMETVSDMIFKGMKGMPFLEAEQARVKAKTPTIVGANGKPAA